MSDRVKRIFFIVAFIVFAGAVAVVIWFVFFRPTSVPPPTTEPTPGLGGELPGAGPAEPGQPTTPTEPGGLPSSGGTPGSIPGIQPTPQTSVLRDGVTQNLSPSADGRGGRYYNPEDGKFYRVSSDGVSVALGDAAFSNVQAVTWGNTSDQAVLEFPDGTKLHYDFRSQTQTTLPKHWDSFDFAPNDTQLVAKSQALTPGSRFLIVTDPQGQNPQAVEALGANESKTFPVWTPNNRIVAYAEVGDAQGFDRQEIILIGKNQENFRSLQVEGRGFVPAWSPDGSRVLYSVWSAASDYRPELWVSGGEPDTVNQDRAKLDLMTWADKCVWADDVTVYCAVPTQLPTGAGLQRDLFTTLPDVFYKIDMRTGAKTSLGAPEGVEGGARNLVVTQDGRHILFTDTQTGNLYDFRIP